MRNDDRNFVYRHEKTYELRYTDVDFKDRLKMSALLGIMEQSACLSADELGFGYDALSEKNYGFVLVNWYVKCERPVMLGENLTVLTWPIKPQRLQVFRDFELYCGDEKVGAATSRWCIVDLADFTLKPSAAVFEGVDIGYNDFRSIDFGNLKLPEVDGETVYSKRAGYSDYDHYNHVNNTKYADYLTDVFGVEFMNNHVLSSLRITYVKQCKDGEVINFKMRFSDGSYYVDGRVNGESRVRFKATFDEV